MLQTLKLVFHMQSLVEMVLKLFPFNLSKSINMQGPDPFNETKVCDLFLRLRNLMFFFFSLTI